MGSCPAVGGMQETILHAEDAVGALGQILIVCGHHQRTAPLPLNCTQQVM